MDDRVWECVDEVVVVRGEEDVWVIGVEVIVEWVNGLEVKVVGGGMENERVGIREVDRGNDGRDVVGRGE